MLKHHWLLDNLNGISNGKTSFTLFYQHLPLAPHFYLSIQKSAIKLKSQFIIIQLISKVLYLNTWYVHAVWMWVSAQMYWIRPILAKYIRIFIGLHLSTKHKHNNVICLSGYGKANERIEENRSMMRINGSMVNVLSKSSLTSSGTLIQHQSEWEGWKILAKRNYIRFVIRLLNDSLVRLEAFKSS